MVKFDHAFPMDRITLERPQHCFMQQVSCTKPNTIGCMGVGENFQASAEKSVSHFLSSEKSICLVHIGNIVMFPWFKLLELFTCICRLPTKLIIILWTT